MITKFLLFWGLSFLVYRLFVKPLFVNASLPPQQSNPLAGFQEILRRAAEQRGQQSQQPPHNYHQNNPNAHKNRPDEGEYVDYEEVK
jgi:hypothetical protein